MMKEKLIQLFPHDGEKIFEDALLDKSSNMDEDEKDVRLAKENE
jgi:hypothetical protein